MEYSALLSHRILFLSEPIDSNIANRLVAQLLLLDANDPNAQIDLYINCPGGSVLDGFAVIDTIQCIKAPVCTICIGKAFSMAAWILAAGKKGLRFATPNVEIMIHQPISSFSGQTSDIQIYTKRMVNLQERLIKMLSDFTGKPENQIREDMKQEFFMAAEEAKNYGIVDEILMPKNKVKR